MRTLLHILFGLYVLSIGADNLSTFQALHYLAEEGAYEQNPLGRWGIESFGLGFYLIINSLASLLGVAWVAYGSFFNFSTGKRVALLGAAGAIRWFAVVNNFYIIHHLLGG